MTIFCASTSCRSRMGLLTECGQKISFHRFPKDSVLKEQWVRNMRQGERSPSNFARLCSLHFEPACYREGFGRRVLHSYAVPTIFPNQTTFAEVGDASGSLTTSQQDGSGRTIHFPEAKEIIASVYRYLHTEYENLKKSYIGSNCDLTPLANILKRTANATGVSEQTVTAVLGKRSQESTHDTVQQKRAKLSYYHGDDDVSPIEEESSCEDIAEGPNEDDEGQTDQGSDPLETLKVELEEEEDEDHRNTVKERMRVEMEATSCETTSAVQHLLSATYADVKTEPVNTDYQQTTSDVHQLLPSEHVEIKQEPSDIEYLQSHSAEPHTPPDAIHNPVKLEPSYGD